MMMSVYDQIRDGAYENKLKLPAFRIGNKSDEGKEARRLYREEEARLVAKFEADLAAEHGLSENPRVGKLFSLAWDYGHSAGCAEVAAHYGELAELLK
jgi:hypothetical protein